jgi:iron complex transport system ATP-binding protein
MSYGEFQKVRIARTFIQESKLMLLDEPVANLDFNAAFLLLKLIKEIARQKKITVIASIHDLNLASVFADKIIMLSKDVKQKSFSGTSAQIITEEIIRKVYNTNCKTFIHPEYQVPQVYVL